LVFVDGAEQDPACDLPVLVFFDDLLDGGRVLLPDLLDNEGWVGQNEVEKVVVLLWDLLWLVEVVLEIIGVFLAEFLV
jgi:hypothetical protein